MATLSITKNWANGDILLESDLDAIKTDVETFVNVTKLNDDNIQNSGITASTKLIDATITTAKLANDAVTAAKLADDSSVDANRAVTTDHIRDSAITTAKIADSNVTSAKLATSAINLVMPSGSIIAYGGSSAPTGYLLCYGQAISRTTYATLFAAIGVVYGGGDGSTTFNLPDLRGRVTVGKDDMGGAAASRMTSGGSGLDGATLGTGGGAQTVALSEANLPAHKHDTNQAYDAAVDASFVAGSSKRVETGVGTGVTNSTLSGSTGSGTAHNNVQPSLIINYIIKT
jgi:microcystin-dependent protein